MKGTETPRRTQKPSCTRRLVGVAVGIGVLALVAVPVYWTALFAYSSFTGCFIECSEPDRLIGALWAGITLVVAIFVIRSLFLAG